jgi:F-type H+-transporting ATPase subunit delta
VKDLLAAERYARAFFDIARLVHQDMELEEELGALSEALKASPDTQKFLENPNVKVEVKRRLLEKIYQGRQHPVYEEFLNFLTLLFEKNRFDLIHEITESFKRIADEAQGEGTAEIASAVALDQNTENRIVSRLEKIAGYKINVKREVNPALIGGVVIKIKHKVLDGSVKGRLEKIKRQLIRIGNV